jgi:hypothetical protein
MEGWIDLYTEHRLAGSTTARMESRNVTDSADVTKMRGAGLVIIISCMENEEQESEHWQSSGTRKTQVQGVPGHDVIALS